MFRRVLALTATMTALGAVTLAPPASAAASNRTTIIITCDRDTSHAVAIVTLYDGVEGSPVGDPTTVTCGTTSGLDKRARVVVTTPSAAGAVSIGGYEVTTAAQTVTCAGEGTLAFDLACTGPTGAGAKVSVR